MAAIFVESPDILQCEYRTVPASGIRLCQARGQPSIGNCAGGVGALNASQAEHQCNTVYNAPLSEGGWGATDLYGDGA
jgi:hypothetical protein